jgi:hypothetical protein
VGHQWAACRFRTKVVTAQIKSLIVEAIRYTEVRGRSHGSWGLNKTHSPPLRV